MGSLHNTLTPPRFIDLTSRLHPSGPIPAPDSPDNYQIIRIYHRVYNGTYHCKNNQKCPWISAHG